MEPFSLYIVSDNLTAGFSICQFGNHLIKE